MLTSMVSALYKTIFCMHTKTKKTFCPYREAVNDIGLSSASGGI